MINTVGWRGRGAFSQWPGRGSFNHLPPWRRPGQLYRPGTWLSISGSRFAPSYRSSPPIAADQIKDLEAYKEKLENELNHIKKEIEQLEKETETKTQEETK